MNTNNIFHAIFPIVHSKSFTTKQQINLQELKYTKTKRKASNARSKHDYIPLWKSECHDHGSLNEDQRLSMSSRRRLDAVEHSSRKNQRLKHCETSSTVLTSFRFKSLCVFLLVFFVIL